MPPSESNEKEEDIDSQPEEDEELDDAGGVEPPLKRQKSENEEEKKVCASKKFQGVCFQFQKGQCGRGENCRFSHEASLDVAEGDSKTDSKTRKNKRGQNKNRKVFQPDAAGVCFKLLQGHCNHGERCKFSHDLEGFLRNKPPNIGDKCYLYDVTGKCRFGFGCCFSSAHTSEDLKQLTKTPAVPYFPAFNEMDLDVGNLLRRRQYAFPKTDGLKAKNWITSASVLPVAAVAAVSVEEVDCKSGLAFAIPGEADLGVPDAADKETKKKKIDIRGKTVLAPLTTVGNTPFRRVCKGLGVDVTIGEMALCQSILKGSQHEWSLFRRHPCEDIFGVQIAGGNAEMVAKTCEVINNEINVDFVDLNCGCPIDGVVEKGMGSALMTREKRMVQIAQAMVGTLNCLATFKMRMGWAEDCLNAVQITSQLEKTGIAWVTIHGRTRRQRYSKRADWEYIKGVAASTTLPVLGNGDIYNFEDYETHARESGVSAQMVARGALVKPWIFTEIKERKHWDITSSERFELLKKFVNYGLENWGSDPKGVETTRRFLLEWLSFLHRYIPLGLLEVQASQINWRAPNFFGRDDLETLMGSRDSRDWVKLTEMLLGKVPDGFFFTPKHKSNAVDAEG